MDPIMMRDALLAELNREATATRRVLQRVPEAKLGWKPHRKSMSLGTLALHVAVVPGAVAEFLNEPVREAPSFVAPEATSKAEILTSFEQGIGNARAKLESWTDDDLRSQWRMEHEGATLMALPRIEMLRSVMLNHWYHHRGELIVYLRLLDVPVPSIYGPTADENPFAVTAGS
jgi:uncharacterized damage-inducible protein DinB